MTKIKDAQKDRFISHNGKEVWRLVEIVSEYGRTKSVREEAIYFIEFSYVHEWKEILKRVLDFDLGGDESFLMLQEEYIARYGQECWQQLFAAFKLVLYHSTLHSEGLHKMIFQK